MENPAIEKLAADIILQRGVTVKIPAPLFLRIFGKKKISLTVTAPYEGTLHRIASYYLNTGLTVERLEDVTVEDALEIMAKHGDAICKAVAVAVLNGYWAGKFFTKPLAWYLKWNCLPRELFMLLSIVIIHGGSSDFMNTTRSVRMMKLTTPNLGQKTEGS